MDFLAKFGLSIIPSKQRVLHAASGRTFSTVAALPPQVQQLLEEFPLPLRPSAAPPKPLHSVVHHIDTGSAAPVFVPTVGSGKNRIAEEEFLAMEKEGIIRHSTCLGRPRCTWSPRRMGLGAPATNSRLLPPQCCQQYSARMLCFRDG